MGWFSASVFLLPQKNLARKKSPLTTLNYDHRRTFQLWKSAQNSTLIFYFYLLIEKSRTTLTTLPFTSWRLIDLHWSDFRRHSRLSLYYVWKWIKLNEVDGWCELHESMNECHCKGSLLFRNVVTVAHLTQSILTLSNNIDPHMYPSPRSIGMFLLFEQKFPFSDFSSSVTDHQGLWQ